MKPNEAKDLKVENVHNLLEAIKAKVEKYDKSDNLNWANVGNLLHAQGQLEDIDTFLRSGAQNV